jgi:hypothetical protein
MNVWIVGLGSIVVPKPLNVWLCEALMLYSVINKNTNMKTILNKHIDLRYLLTPVASTVWDLPGGIKARMIYIFGIRVCRITL